MKLSESWLQEWVNPHLSRETLCSKLAMSGFEIEEVQLLADDAVIDFAITPNRGDCLSVRGMAREISAITEADFTAPSFNAVTPTIPDTIAVRVEAPESCPRYTARIIRGLSNTIQTPVEIRDRLQKSGLNSISLVVDIVNYVMLELGQPMHAFDLDTIHREVIIRHAKPQEKIQLLDGSEKTLDTETVCIADSEKPLAIAGVMGGLDSGVRSLTTHILLESAYFAPTMIAKQRQRHLLHSDSAYRFERGVDPTIQREAIERVTHLLLTHAGGSAGPVVEVVHETSLPPLKTITVSAKAVKELLGISIDAAVIESIFTRLQCPFTTSSHETWAIEVPTYRFDLAIPEDVIEEIARLYGYENIPTQPLEATLQAPTAGEADHTAALRDRLCATGYHEVISYSFIDQKLQTLLDPAQPAVDLLNPISTEMAVMRTNLFGGLINTYLYNHSRQQQRIRLFEIGTCFTRTDGVLHQVQKIAGLSGGAVAPAQWGTASRAVDFYDVKGDIESTLHPICNKLNFKKESHPALHPGQTAGIYVGDQKIGVLGVLHPQIQQTLDIQEKIVLFELDLNFIKFINQPIYKEISKFPEIRRDLALLVNQTVPVEEIQDRIRLAAGSCLCDVFVFDVYQGKGITPGHKSIAVGLVWQHPTRTLVDDEINVSLARVVAELREQLGITLRS